MRTLLAGVLALALMGAPLHAQILDSGFINAGTACTTAGACVSAVLGEASSVSIQIVGTFSATLSFEGTADGTTWVAVQVSNAADGVVSTSTTAAGTFSLTNYGLQKVRVRASAYTSGGAQVTFVRGYGTVRWSGFSQLTVTNLTVSGTAKFADGSAAAPSFTFASNTGLGFFKQATNSIGVTFAGTEGIRLTGNDVRILSAAGALILGTGQDTTLARAAAQVLALGPTTGVRLNWTADGALACQNFAGTAGCALSTLTTQTTAVAVGSLPTCNAGAEGKRAAVTDASATLTAGIGTTVANGGANHVPVYCDGTNWIIG